MDGDISAVRQSRYGHYPNNGQYEPYNRNSSYNGNQSGRRKVIGSPEGTIENKIISPVISPLGAHQSITKEILLGKPVENTVSGYPSFLDNNVSGGKETSYRTTTLSPPVTEVSMPGGFTYVIDEDKINSNNRISNSSLPRQTPSRIMDGRQSNMSQRSTHSQFEPRQVRQKSLSRDEYYDGEYTPRGNRRDRQDNYRNRRSRRNSRRPEYSDDDISDGSESESENSKTSSRAKQKREKDKQRDKLVDMLLEDYVERKKKEKEEEELKKTKSQSQKQTPSKLNPGFEKPTVGEPVPQKSKIPNYEDYSELDKDKIKEKFRNNYNTLIVSYPKWKIEMPDFDLLPLRLIHERYETVVRTICIYQTAMKWKVYLIIIIAGIEYYGYNMKKYAFLKGLLKEQIKSIHKYDNYLVEFAGMFFSDEVGDDYPVWMRFLGTFASSLGCFSSINGIVKLLGKDASAPEFVFEQADRFVSPPEGTARLHSDGISDPPDVPSGLQDSNTLIGVIGNIFGMFTGQNKAPAEGASNNANPQNAVPVQADSKPKVVDDYENADF